MVNACDRLYVGEKCSHMPQLSQAVPAAMSQVGRRHMRTRLYANVFADIREFVMASELSKRQSCMKWRHRKKKKLFSRLIDEYTPKTKRNI